MKRIKLFITVVGLAIGQLTFAQVDKEVIQQMVKEANDNSQLELLAHEMLDVIGPRLVGTPQMQQAGDWAVEKYKQWGIPAENEQWGEWRGWDRGITHIDMVHPRIQSLNGTQLAWSPSTGKRGVTGELITLPMVENAAQFEAWLPNVKGKLVMINMKELTGRPDYNWEEFATEESFDKMKEKRQLQREEWAENMRRIGHNRRTLPTVLEEAGAIGIVTSYWSRGFGAN
ncbi:MAG: peptidase M28, partial [Arenibacter sp.]|nr:peptidase M28 [Arenibacter sp.]